MFRKKLGTGTNIPVPQQCGPFFLLENLNNVNKRTFSKLRSYLFLLKLWYNFSTLGTVRNEQGVQVSDSWIATLTAVENILWIGTCYPTGLTLLALIIWFNPKMLFSYLCFAFQRTDTKRSPIWPRNSWKQHTSSFGAGSSCDSWRMGGGAHGTAHHHQPDHWDGQHIRQARVLCEGKRDNGVVGPRIRIRGGKPRQIHEDPDPVRILAKLCRHWK